MLEPLEIGMALVGLGMAFALGWLISSSRSNVKLATSEIRTEAQADALNQATEAMQNEFKAIASDALQGNSEQFLQVAEEKLKVHTKEGEKVLGEQKMAMENLVVPIRESLDKLEKNSHAMEEKREGAYQGMKRQVEELQKATTGLRDSSVQLSTALRGSIKDRGNWGQVSLKNVAEAAGMLEHCDFDIEYTLKSGKGGARVDMLAKIPGGEGIPVDAKVPLANYWDALETDDQERKGELMLKHCKDVKKHIDDLAERDYSGILGPNGADFTVMYIPAEPILAAAYEHQPDLQEYAFKERILIVTPVTLIALLRTVGVYWQQQSIAENAQDILQHAQEFYQRSAKFSGDLAKMGRGLNTALNAYNEAATSFATRLMPSGRRLEEFKVTDGLAKKVEEMKLIDGSATIIESALLQEE